MSKSERHYCVTRKESLAVTHFVMYFKHYLFGIHFLVRMNSDGWYSLKKTRRTVCTLDRCTVNIQLQNRTSSRKVTYKYWCHENHFIKSLVPQFDRFCIKDRLACRKSVDMSNQTLYECVVPNSELRTILKLLHDEKTSGHLGIKKPLSKNS